MTQNEELKQKEKQEREDCSSEASIQLIAYISNKIEKIKKDNSKEKYKNLVEVVSSKRNQTGNQPHLRLRFLNENENELEILNLVLFNSARKSKFKRSEALNRVSGYYSTEILTTEEKISNIPAGTKIHFISTDPNKKASFNKNSSELKPSKFKFNGRIFSEENLSRDTKEAFENIKSVSKIKPEIKQFCIDLLEQIENSVIRNGIETQIQSELGEKIQNQDINTVAKNFGEILGAAWYMKVDPIKNTVEYPSSDTQQIVDYTVHANNSNLNYQQPISAKSKTGAASAISGLISRERSKIIKMRRKAEDKDKKYNSFLQKITSLNLQESLIYANLGKGINETKACETLREMVKFDKTDTPKTIIKKFDKFVKENYTNVEGKNLQDRKILKETTKKFISDFSQFFKDCDYNVDSSKVPNKLKSQNKIDLILYPLGKAAVNEMNNDDGLIKYFNLIMKNSGIAQVSIYLTKNSIKFNLYNDPRLESSKGFYTFEYNAYYDSPRNRGLSFKLGK